MPKVYLAGPILGTTPEQGMAWRELTQEYLWNKGVDAFSPLRGKDYLHGYDLLPDTAEQYPLSTQSGIVCRDRNDVMTCDLMLMNLLNAPRVSIGTMVELGWADAFRKPVVAMVTPQDLHWHAFVRELSGFVVPTLEQALEIIPHILNS